VIATTRGSFRHLPRLLPPYGRDIIPGLEAGLATARFVFKQLRFCRQESLMGYLTNFYRDSHQEEPKNDKEKSKAAPRYNQPIARKSCSKFPVTS